MTINKIPISTLPSVINLSKLDVVYGRNQVKRHIRIFVTYVASANKNFKLDRLVNLFVMMVQLFRLIDGFSICLRGHSNNT